MKARLSHLAILGGPAAFKEPLHVGRPNLGSRERLLDRLGRMLDSRRLTNDGPYVREFEEAIRAHVGVKHCVATANATLALEILVRATGLSGEVLVPAFTFIATAHALNWMGLTPAFVDIDPETHTIDPEQVEASINPRTTAILGVHLWGRACNIEALETIAARSGLTLLFDAAQATGSCYRGHPIGRHGVAEVLSFHATKVVNSFEGGAILTNDDHLAHVAMQMRNLGFTDFDQVSGPGTNAKMTEVAAAMGLTSLESLSEFIHANRERHSLYQRELSATPGIRILEYDQQGQSNFHYVVLEIDDTITGVSRDVLQKVLAFENVLARRYFYPGCHRMEPYRSMQPRPPWHLPVTERVAARVLCLPTGPQVPLGAIPEICGLIRLALAHGDELQRVAFTM